MKRIVLEKKSKDLSKGRKKYTKRIFSYKGIVSEPLHFFSLKIAG